MKPSARNIVAPRPPYWPAREASGGGGVDNGNRARLAETTDRDEWAWKTRKFGKVKFFSPAFAPITRVHDIFRARFGRGTLRRGGGKMCANFGVSHSDFRGGREITGIREELSINFAESRKNNGGKFGRGNLWIWGRGGATKMALRVKTARNNF